MEYTTYDQLPLVLTVEELAELLHLGKASTYNLIHSGQVRCVKSGNKYIIPKSSVVEYLTPD